jgi:hypothetical protein
VPTLLRATKGDPSVSAGVPATSVWPIGGHEALEQLAEPKEDPGALKTEIQTAGVWAASGQLQSERADPRRAQSGVSHEMGPYFPMQNLPKISPSSSSVPKAPVISPSAW